MKGLQGPKFTPSINHPRANSSGILWSEEFSSLISWKRTNFWAGDKKSADTRSIFGLIIPLHNLMKAFISRTENLFRFPSFIMQITDHKFHEYLYGRSENYIRSAVINYKI